MFDSQGKFSKRKRNDDSEDWMTTFADMTTLLLAFFVLLASISKVDVVLFEQVKAGMAEGIGRRQVETPVESLKEDIAETIKSLKVEDKVGVGTDNRGITIEFAAASFFPPGQAQFTEEAVPVLSKIAATIGSDRYTGFQIEVQGHTDDTPTHTAQFPSNWELSSARASSVVRYFMDVGISPTRMKAVGFADTAPKVPNRGPTGEPIPQNQEINRRVVVRIFPR